jgi:hypothetical protein
MIAAAYKPHPRQWTAPPAGQHAAMTPKQAAARLLLATIRQGTPHPSKLDRLQMAEALDSRISDEKRAKILDFVTKIETPYLERLARLSGEGDDEAAEGAAPAAPAPQA